jgi:hypothetical protein
MSECHECETELQMSVDREKYATLNGPITDFPIPQINVGPELDLNVLSDMDLSDWNFLFREEEDYMGVYDDQCFTIQSQDCYEDS